MLRDIVMPVAAPGMNQVHLSDGSSTSANEAAITTAITHYARTHNRADAKLSVLGFENAAHGQSVATLSCSDSQINAKNVPTYDWPTAPLPKMTYPLAKNTAANI